MQHIVEFPEDPSSGRAAGGRRPSVFLATPCFGCQVTLGFAESVLRLTGELARLGVEFECEFIGNESLVERARNVLTAKFLESSHTHLLFVDADIRFAPESVVRMLEFDKDVVSGVYCKKRVDWQAVKRKAIAGDPEPTHQAGLDFVINRPREPFEDGFARVLDTATGFLLIKREVIERMYERFADELTVKNDIQKGGKDIESYVALFACMIDPDTRRFLSEDYSFCRRYQQLGGDIWACLATSLAHAGPTQFRCDVRDQPDEKKPAAK